MVRGKDACWEYCAQVDASRQQVRCNYCQREFCGGVYRMKFHLAQVTNRDIIPCPDVPDDVRDKVLYLLSFQRKYKTRTRLRLEARAKAQQHTSSSSSGAHQNASFSDQFDSPSPSPESQHTTQQNVAASDQLDNPTPYQLTPRIAQQNGENGDQLDSATPSQLSPNSSPSNKHPTSQLSPQISPAVNPASPLSLHITTGVHPSQLPPSISPRGRPASQLCPPISPHDHPASQSSPPISPHGRPRSQLSPPTLPRVRPASQLSPPTSPRVHPAADEPRIWKQNKADKKIAEFFFHNAISLNAAKSMYYQEMIDAVIECGAGYKAPSHEMLDTSLLEKVKGDINEYYRRQRDEWKETGCTLLCESLSNQGGKLFLVFSVVGPKASFFLKSVDVSAQANDAHFLFEVLESVILEVGLDKVVQVITNGNASFVYTGRLLMAKYTSLFWSPCASYCINRMLEEIGEIKWVELVLEDSKRIATYLYSDPWIVAAMRKFTGSIELIRPKITRCATHFLTLRAVVLHEDNLKKMFSQTDWLSSVYGRLSDAHAVNSLLYSERFWKAAHEAASITEPLLMLLRMVDGDMPAMGYIYEGIERAKIAIKAYCRGVEEQYLPIWDIIDRIWNLQHNSSLHAAAAFLNPSIYYCKDRKIDRSIRNGFLVVMMRMTADENDKIEFTKQHPVYINAQGALGTDFAMLGRTLNTPGEWWATYGYEIRTLQKAAIRILSQPCSSHWCRWNWSTFESLHSKQRDPTELSKFCDLVFVHCNLWLQAISSRMNGKSEPVVYEEIDLNGEWPTESDVSSPLVNDS